MITTVDFVRDKAKQATFFAEVEKKGYGLLSIGSQLIAATLASEQQREQQLRSCSRLRKISRITQLGGFSGLLGSKNSCGHAFFVVNPENPDVMIRFKYVKEHDIKDVLELDKSGAVEARIIDLGYTVFRGKFFKVGE